MTLETPFRIEPTKVGNVPGELVDITAELSSAAETLGKGLHPATAANLAALVRIMNTYYSNLIEGHNTRPRDIERALSGDLDEDPETRNLQVEAAAHVRLQAEIDRLAGRNGLPEPANGAFICWLHQQFYHGASQEMLTIRGNNRSFQMTPGQWRSLPEHDVEVGRLVPPSSPHIPNFMTYFEEHYRLANSGKGTRILAIPAAHHRFNYIHPFPDGNGRVSRLMSHAMGHHAGIAANGLWSISRGLARGLNSRTEYKSMMDRADSPRQGDFDGRGNLSERALVEFSHWFLSICLDQVKFMTSLFEIDTLSKRLRKYVDQSETLKPETANILEEALIRGEVERGMVERII